MQQLLSSELPVMLFAKVLDNLNWDILRVVVIIRITPIWITSLAINRGDIIIALIFLI